MWVNSVIAYGINIYTNNNPTVYGGVSLIKLLM